MPFRRGRKTAPESRAPLTLAWISPAVSTRLQGEGTDAHRIASAPGTWIERFGSDLMLSYQSEPDRDHALAEIDGRCAGYGFQPRRIFGKYLPHYAAERSAPALLRGDAAIPMEVEVREANVRFGLDFATGYSAGFFIDQRENRARLREYRPRRLLNTFAYTCSFSVVAALAGAETVSLDLSRRSLARGEENFQRNGLDPKAGHKFIADDVLAVLPRLARRGEKFDGIILDPPTFSRNKSGDDFQVQRDFERLVLLALEVAAPSAKILLSVNHSDMRVADLERAARSAFRLQKRTGRFHASAPLADFPLGHGAKTVWLELGG
jgi:23S rRNA (cytosine1962-C5)-methyltransferase